MTLETLSCVPPPPQMPCDCPEPCQASASQDGSPPAAGTAPGNGSAGTPDIAVPADQQTLTQRFATTRALDVLRGEASYYGDTLAGNQTASGEVYDPRDYTAAHRNLPFGTLVRVVRTDRDPARLVYVRITDRGPFGDRKRIIDLSRAAAEQLDMIRDGVVDVRVEVVAYPSDR